MNEPVEVVKASQASNDVEPITARPDFSSDDEDPGDAQKIVDEIANKKKKKGKKKKKAKQLVYSGK